MELDQTRAVEAFVKGERVLLALAYAVVLPLLAVFEVVLGLWQSGPYIAAFFLALSLLVAPIAYFGTFLVYPLRIVVDGGVIELDYRFRSKPISRNRSDLEYAVVLRLKPHRFRRLTIYAVRIRERGLRSKSSKMLVDESTYRELELWLSKGGVSVRMVGGFSPG